MLDNLTQILPALAVATAHVVDFIRHLSANGFVAKALVDSRQQDAQVYCNWHNRDRTLCSLIQKSETGIDRTTPIQRGNEGQEPSLSE